MATYPIRQLADNGGTAQFVPVTAPEAVQFPDGSNLNTFIGSVATIESNPVAANHAVGEFLCVNGQVYEVIDAITAGDSIALGENVQVANLGSQITALNNGLISVDYTAPIAITNDAQSHSGTFTAPRSGFAFMNWQCTDTMGWVDISVNGILVATGGVVGGTIASIPLKKGDVMTWESSSTGYIRGNEPAGLRSKFC